MDKKEASIIESLFWAALELQMFIEQVKKDDPVLWAVDNKTPVVNLDEYKRSCKTIKEVGTSLGYEKCFIQ